MRAVVAHWYFRWAGVLVCALLWRQAGVVFDYGWLPLGILIAYDIVRTLTTMDRPVPPFPPSGRRQPGWLRARQSAL